MSRRLHRAGRRPGAKAAGRLLVLLAASAACNLIRAPGPATPTPALKPSPEANVLAAFDASDESWVALHHAVQEAPQDVIREATELLGSADPAARFAAVYALGLTVDASQVHRLRPALSDPNPHLRTMAAGALIGLGEVESIPILIEALAGEENLPFVEPPTRAWTIAHAALTHYTEQDFGLLEAIQSGDEVGRQAALAAWQAWWAEAGPDLTWDAASQRYLP